MNTSKSNIKNLTPDQRETLYSQLQKWFYEEGNGIFLSEKAFSLYQTALNALENKEKDIDIDTRIVRTFKDLRKIIKNDIGIYGKVSPYNYRTTKDITIFVNIRRDIKTDFITLNMDGELTVKKGYAWYGPSGPTIDTKSFMRGSLIHDALYQLIREGYLGPEQRIYADNLLRHIVLSDGMSKFRAWYIHKAVRMFRFPASVSKKRQKNLFYEKIQDET